ncbi:cyclin-a2-4 [Anaeramoeba flamelloides]|uniref:Cyclin-a2-4 n=1 Tax=Anaeramoeba flamelloides TaxID=1746091 RepID=A0ABQ8XQ28_9EUKA|nr:cyclin-a2-4 [Anaeramoeba flamelloides]
MFYRIKKSSNFYNKENEDPNESSKHKIITKFQNQLPPKEKRALRDISNFPNLNKNINEKNKARNQKQSLNQKHSHHVLQKKNYDQSQDENMGSKIKEQEVFTSPSSLSDYESQTNPNISSENDISLNDEIESENNTETESEEEYESEFVFDQKEKNIVEEDEDEDEDEEEEEDEEDEEEEEKYREEEYEDGDEEGCVKEIEKNKEIDKILDINFHHRNDILFVSEYSKEIYENYRKRETNHLPSPTYLEDKQKHLQSLQRKILVNWMNAVCQELNLHSETYYLAINYFDRFLTKQETPQRYLQLVAITCIFIASKYEEIYSPEIEELSEYTKNFCTPVQILRSETLILNCLRFQCTVVTPKHFLRWYLRASSASIKVMLIANYLLELQSLEYFFLYFKPSMIAACCVAAARWILYDQNNDLEKKNWWDKTMEHYTGYTDTELKECMSFLIQAFKNAPTSKYKSPYEKYGDENLREVSKLKIKTEFN